MRALFVLVALVLASAPALGRKDVRCGSRFGHGDPWRDELLKRGYVTGPLNEWIPPILHDTLLRAFHAWGTRLGNPLLMRPSEVDEEVQPTFEILSQAFEQMSLRAADALRLKGEVRDATLDGLPFLRRYGADETAFRHLERWHPDGGWLQIVAALEGPGPHFHRGSWRFPLKVPEGHFALFLGTDLAKHLGAPAPLHRSPKNRARVVGLFRSPWEFER